MDETLPHMILLAVLLAAVVTDIRSYRIPNWLTLPAMACGLFLHTVMQGQQGFLISIQGLAVGLGLFLVFYATGGMGAGDVKLMAAVGSFLGPLGVVYAAVMTMLLGGLYAVTTMIARYGLRESLMRVWALLTTLAFPEDMPEPAAGPNSRYQLRYAMVIGLGTMLSQMILVG